jgi:hypothetical protein
MADISFDPAGRAESPARIQCRCRRRISLPWESFSWPCCRPNYGLSRLRENTMATDFVKLAWELTRKVKLTSPGCTVGLATHDGRMYGRGYRARVPSRGQPAGASSRGRHSFGPIRTTAGGVRSTARLQGPRSFSRSPASLAPAHLSSRREANRPADLNNRTSQL